MAAVPSIPQPRFARMLPGLKLPPPTDDVYRQKVMVLSHRGSIWDLQFEKNPTPSMFRSLSEDEFQR